MSLRNFLEQTRACIHNLAAGPRGRAIGSGENVLDDRPIEDILRQMLAMTAEDRLRAEQGALVRVEFAAQVAELANAQRTHDPLQQSTDFLDGYVEGFERAAELIRQLDTIISRRTS